MDGVVLSEAGIALYTGLPGNSYTGRKLPLRFKGFLWFDNSVLSYKTLIFYIYSDIYRPTTETPSGFHPVTW